MNIESIFGIPTIEYFDGKQWKLTENLCVLFDNKESVSASIGFPTNGTSYPKILWPILGHPFAGAEVWASFVHDWLCCYRKTDEGRMLTRGECDGIFYKILLYVGVLEKRAKLLYFGVKMFSSWIEYNDADERRKSLKQTNFMRGVYD